MIEELKFQGFRSLRDVRWKPGRLNVLIGPNGSGKSNLLQGLILLQKAAAGNVADLPDSLLRDESAPSISWAVRTQNQRGESFLYEIELGRRNATSSYGVVRESLFESNHRPPNREPTECEASLFKKGLLGWGIYQDLRVDPEAPLRQASVARFEKQLAAGGQNLAPVLHTLYSGTRDFKRSVDAAMRAAFGTDYQELVFTPTADQKVRLGVRWKSLKAEQFAPHLSDSTLRLLLMIAILANPESGDLIAIDQPETGFHPSLLPIIAELAAEASERTQVILTTCSPQLLDAFTGEPPTITVSKWIAGETRLSVLDGEELSRWLGHYSLGAMLCSGELEELAGL
jgi:predicted ATPase